MEEGTDYVFHKLAGRKDQYGALLVFGVDRLDVLGNGLQQRAGSEESGRESFLDDEGGCRDAARCMLAAL